MKNLFIFFRKRQLSFPEENEKIFHDVEEKIIQKRTENRLKSTIFSQ